MSLSIQLTDPKKYEGGDLCLYQEEKGDIMTRLIKETKDYDIAFPLDIDEFIVHYKEKERKVDPEKSVVYLQDLIKTNILRRVLSL